MVSNACITYILCVFGRFLGCFTVAWVILGKDIFGISALHRVPLAQANVGVEHHAAQRYFWSVAGFGRLDGLLPGGSKAGSWAVPQVSIWHSGDCTCTWRLCLLLSCQVWIRLNREGPVYHRTASNAVHIHQ